jgi:hypothetical protein
LKDLLKFSRRFPHFAPFNAMLLHVQNPGIQYALTPSRWEKKYDRRVKPGARPYVILRTMGPVEFVFDLSDTEPINPRDDRVPEQISNPFRAKGAPPPGALRNLKKACAEVSIQFEEKDLATNMAGCVYHTQQYAWDFYLQLNVKHTEAQKLGTLAHELAHVFCGHLGKTEKGFWPDRPNLNKPCKEFEAEAVAYLVTDRMNLDVGSVEYLAGYLREDQLLPDYSLDCVLKAAGKVEEMAAGLFRPKKKD